MVTATYNLAKEWGISISHMTEQVYHNKVSNSIITRYYFLPDIMFALTCDYSDY